MDNPIKFLIIGANGLIGKAMVEEIRGNFEWTGTSLSRKKNNNTLHLDITKVSDLKNIFQQVKPSCVIHCAQLAGGVDFCDEHLDLAKNFHFEATVNLGNECIRNNVKFVFISSECVFDGKKELYNELDPVNPLNTYGEYKAKSENWIKKNVERHIIIRSMSVYGWDPLTVTPNAVMKVYFSINKGEKIFIPDFRWGTPTYVRDLARAMLEISLSKETGLFHIAGASYLNRYEWLKKTCHALGWDASLLLPQKNIDSHTACRPSKIGLDTGKFRKFFKTQLHNIEDSLNLLKKDSFIPKKQIEA